MVSASNGDISHAERLQNQMISKNDSQASDNRKPPSTLIVGPSHTIRWAWHVRDGVVPCRLPSDRIIGHGGAPIWSKTLLNKSMAATGSDDFLTIMVPDFRFGNGICFDQAALRSDTMQDGFSGIDGRAMATEHDRTMFDRSMAALQIWHQRFGHRARYIFWCLFGRQIFDRLAGRHIQDGGYRHPFFNYQAIIDSLPDFDIVDLSPLLRMPMHEVRRLFIDSSAHPSQIGYLLLNGLLSGLTATEAYRQAVAEIEGHLENAARRIAAAKGQKLLLTGRSIWLDTMMSYMGADGVARLAEAGLVLAPLDRLPGQPTIAQLTSDVKPADCAVVILSAGGADLSDPLARAFGNAASAWKDVPCIDWESATIPAIAGRKEVPAFSRLDPKLPLNPGAFRPDLRPDMVEQGPLGMPSWTGLNHILEIIIPNVVNTSLQSESISNSISIPKINRNKQFRAFFCINEHGLTKNKLHYEDHIRVCLTSCLLNTNLFPTLIYSGKDNEFIRSIEKSGINVIRHRISFYEELKKACQENNVDFGVAEGAFLRLDIPEIAKEEKFSLYTDVDVLFQRHPHIESIFPEFIAATSEIGFEHYGHMNSGVMILNHNGITKEKTHLVNRIIDGNLKSSSGDPYDQGHLNDHFKGRWNIIDQSFNWKPYWGLNKFAPIVHWHGVKFHAAVSNMIPSMYSYNKSHMHTDLFKRSPDAYAWYIRCFSEILEKSLF